MKLLCLSQSLGLYKRKLTNRDLFMKKLFIFFILTIVLVSCKKEKGNEDFKVDMFDFTDKDVSGFYKEKKYNLIILNYWATYCSPCKEEMLDFVKLNDMYNKKGVLIIGATSETNDSYFLIEKLCKKLKINYPILYGVENRFNNEHITGLPTTFIINSKFEVVEKITGKKSINYFEDIITSTL